MTNKYITSIRSRERAFTLIELLVVILIIGILLAIALPTFLDQQKKGQDASAKQSLNTVYKVATSEATSNGGNFPAAAAIIPALTQSEPELNVDQTTLSAPTDATEGHVSILAADATGFQAVTKSASGCISTVTVIGRGQPAYDCQPAESFIAPDEAGPTCAGQTIGQNPPGGYYGDPAIVAEDLALIHDLCVLHHRIETCYASTNDYRECVNPSQVNTTGLNYDQSHAAYSAPQTGGPWTVILDPDTYQFPPEADVYVVRGMTASGNIFSINEYYGGPSYGNEYYLGCGNTPGVGLCRTGDDLDYTWVP